MTDISTRPDLVTTDEGDHDRFAHVVPFAEKLTDAIINGTAVRAACGKLWIPLRDPKKYPVCPTCREVVRSWGREVPSS